jgi:hypothetical protein
MSPSEVIQDASDRWINIEHLMNLSPNKQDVDNANDVLYMAVFVQLIKLLDIDSAIYTYKAILGCGILRKEPGNFLRFKRDPIQTNSHDNYDAIAAIHYSLADEIRIKGDEIGWDFNLTYDQGINLKTLRQPGTIAYTQLCAEKRPYLLNFSFLIIGLIIGSFSFNSHVHHITWMRSHKLRQVVARYAVDKAWLHLVLPLAVTFLIFDLASILKFGNRHQAVVNYYTEVDHPNRRLALELIRKETLR